MATELKLYNTLTRSKETFKPIDSQNVRLYACGPTVYDFAHIGNARPVIVFDVLFRLLRHVYDPDHVTYVRNITDVDDKINARALRDFPDLPLNEAIRSVTAKTADQFHEDVKALGCLAPTHEPRATEHIEGMVKIIQQLLSPDKNGVVHAYVAEGVDGREALFDVRSMHSYGALSKRNLNDQQAGARVAVEAHKRNPEDFVLWKESAPSEPGWSAAFVISDNNRDALRLNSNNLSIFGRPGWHIECSAMSEHFLGETFDIHAGGLDLIFPHHENEIAQSRCAHGTDVMAKVWMHNGFLQVEGRKMSKSEGNFVTINELLHTEKFGGRKWPGEVLRLAMLMTHYREPIDFSVRRLQEAFSKYENWNAIVSGLTLPQLYGVPSEEIVGLVADDLNFHSAINFLDECATKVTKGAYEADQLASDLGFLGLISLHDPWDRFSFKAMQSQLRQSIADVEIRNQRAQQLGIDLEMVRENVQARLAFLAAKNFAEADRIRDELLAQGIQLKDSKDSVTGERVTSWEVKR
jgi:cysteinyl-tRNA synthetase